MLFEQCDELFISAQLNIYNYSDITARQKGFPLITNNYEWSLEMRGYSPAAWFQ